MLKEKMRFISVLTTAENIYVGTGAHTSFSLFRDTFTRKERGRHENKTNRVESLTFPSFYSKKILSRLIDRKSKKGIKRTSDNIFICKLLKQGC